MSALICGSLAYDTIMVFPDQFKNHILPDKVHILNVSFLVPRMRREFGGCAGNIAYNLHLLGGEPLPMATVGQDFGPYRAHFDALGIRRTSQRFDVRTEGSTRWEKGVDPQRVDATVAMAVKMFKDMSATKLSAACFFAKGHRPLLLI